MPWTVRSSDSVALDNISSGKPDMARSMYHATMFVLERVPIVPSVVIVPVTVTPETFTGTRV